MNILMRVLPYVAAVLCAAGAGETFKSHKPSVGVPLFIMGVATMGFWLLMWTRLQARNR